MSLHKLNPERAPFADEALPVGIAFEQSRCDLAETVVRSRGLRALHGSAARYPIHRTLRYAVRRRLEEVVDDLALNLGLGAVRLDEWSMLLDGVGVFIQVEARRKAEYTSLWFGVWTESRQRADELRADIDRVVGDCYSREQMFTIDWYYSDGYGSQSKTFDELFIDVLHDEAYPTLDCSVSEFATRYLDANETVLVLQGTPGTGKTRLVRAILSAMSHRKHNSSARVMYTADRRLLEHDEIFVDFVTGWHDAFIIEDADHMLLARSDGNKDLHRFLAAADGIVRAKGRKIIFTTNLPNLRDIDEALLRPGRCFATVCTRSLKRTEAARLLARLLPEDQDHASMLDLLFAAKQGVPVAEIYRACNAIVRSA